MKECCATCRYFEEWFEDDSAYGLCEFDAEIIDTDPNQLTCFNWEESEYE